MFELMIYSCVIALIVGLAAHWLELAVDGSGWPRRWIWAATIALIVLATAAVALGFRALDPEAPGTAAALPSPNQPNSPGTAADDPDRNGRPPSFADDRLADAAPARER